MQKRIDLIAKDRAAARARQYGNKKMGNLLMNAMLRGYGMAGPVDVTDPISLAFIKAHGPVSKK